MDDKNKEGSAASRAGRWFAKLLGRRNVEKLADSARALRDEYRAGRAEARDEPPEQPVKSVPHRVVDPDEADGENG